MQIMRLRPIGLVQRSTATQRSCYIHQINRVNSRIGSAIMTEPYAIVMTITITIIIFRDANVSHVVSI